MPKARAFAILNSTDLYQWLWQHAGRMVERIHSGPSDKALARTNAHRVRLGLEPIAREAA